MEAIDGINLRNLMRSINSLQQRLAEQDDELTNALDDSEHYLPRNHNAVLLNRNNINRHVSLYDDVEDDDYVMPNYMQPQRRKVHYAVSEQSSEESLPHYMQPVTPKQPKETKSSKQVQNKGIVKQGRQVKPAKPAASQARSKPFSSVDQVRTERAQKRLEEYQEEMDEPVLPGRETTRELIENFKLMLLNSEHEDDMLARLQSHVSQALVTSQILVENADNSIRNGMVRAPSPYDDTVRKLLSKSNERPLIVANPSRGKKIQIPKKQPISYQTAGGSNYEYLEELDKKSPDVEHLEYDDNVRYNEKMRQELARQSVLNAPAVKSTLIEQSALSSTTDTAIIEQASQFKNKDVLSLNVVKMLNSPNAKSINSPAKSDQSESPGNTGPSAPNDYSSKGGTNSAEDLHQIVRNLMNRVQTQMEVKPQAEEPAKTVPNVVENIIQGSVVNVLKTRKSIAEGTTSQSSPAKLEPLNNNILNEFEVKVAEYKSPLDEIVASFERNDNSRFRDHLGAINKHLAGLETASIGSGLKLSAESDDEDNRETPFDLIHRRVVSNLITQKVGLPLKPMQLMTGADIASTTNILPDDHLAAIQEMEELDPKPRKKKKKDKSSKKKVDDESATDKPNSNEKISGDGIFGLKFKDGVVLSSSGTFSRGVTMHHNYRWIRKVGNTTLLGLFGDVSDCDVFHDVIEYRNQMQEMNFGRSLDVNAVAALCRSEIVNRLRRKPLALSALVGGWDQQRNESVLYWLDSYGSMRAVEYGAHGEEMMLMLSTLDRQNNQKICGSKVGMSGLSLDQAQKVVNDCWSTVRKRSMKELSNHQIEMITRSIE